MKLKSIRLAVCVSICFLIFSNVLLFSKNTFFDIAVGINRFSGDTTYTIGNKITYPNGDVDNVPWTISQLKFPLNVFWAYLDMGLNVTNMISMQVHISKNIDTGAGKLEDIDRLYSASQVDVYSLSDTMLNGFIFDGNFQFKPLHFFDDKFHIGLGAGFLYQRLYIEASNVDQSYPLYPDQEHFTTNIVVIKYTAQYYMPYLELVSKLEILDLADISLSAGFSPYAWGDDYDEHLLRSKTSIGNDTGTGWKFAGDVRYFIEQNIFLSMNFKYITLSLNGKQKQISDGNVVGTIDQTLSTSQLSAGLSLGYSFY